MTATNANAIVIVMKNAVNVTNVKAQAKDELENNTGNNQSIKEL